jgi:hypothetical protein
MDQLHTKFSENDLVSLYELNLKAARLWERALACYSRNAEAVREAYARASFACIAWPGPSLSLAFAEFRQDVRGYLATSFFRTPQLLVENRMDIALRLLNRQPLIAVSNENNLPSIHPIFSQVILELQLELFPISENISSERLATRLSSSGQDRLFLVLAHFDYYFPGRGADHFGLWPAAARAARFWRFYQMLGLLASETGGHVRLRRPVGITTDIDHQRLPDFYLQNAQAIPVAMRDIGQRYNTILRR